MPAWPEREDAEKWLSHGQGVASVEGVLGEVVGAATVTIRGRLDDRLLPDQTGDEDDRCPEPVRLAILMLTSRLVARKGSPTGVVGMGELAVEIMKRDPDIEALIAQYRTPDIDGLLDGEEWA